MTDDTPTDSTADQPVPTKGDAREAVSESGNERAIVDQLRDQTVPLETTDPTVPFEQTAIFDRRFADARIVGLGESTHGTREFFQMKDRIIRHLVREEGLRVVAIEANLPEAFALDEYVVHGTGDPAKALENIYFWTWNVDSVLALVEWLREFNDGRPPTDCVRFHGFDAQYTAGAIERLRAYFDETGFELPATIQTDLDVIDDSGEHEDEPWERDTYGEAAERVVPALRDQLADSRADLVSASSERDWTRATHLVTVIEQATTFREASQQITDEDDEAMRRALRVRDQAMADNVDWLLSSENTDQIALWGHDAHINRSKQPVRDRDIAEPSMGAHLAERHGRDYVALGFTFGSGTFQALSESGTDSDGETSYELQGQALQSPVAGTIDETFAELDFPVALLDIRGLSPANPLPAWLDTPHQTFSAGATYDPGSPEEYVNEYVFAEAFDALCYVAETTRARPVDTDLPDP